MFARTPLRRSPPARLRTPPPHPQQQQEARQSLAVGEITLDAAARLGAFHSNYMPVSPASALVTLTGRAGQGKSTLLHSCPYMHVMNADVSPTPSRTRCSISPGVRRDRAPVKFNPSYPNDPEHGLPITVDYEFFREQEKVLIEMAHDDFPGRPKAVASDTVDKMVPMIQRWMVDKYNADDPKQIKDEFNELHGLTAYPQLFEEVVRMGRTLNLAGYGYWWVFHLGNKSIYLKPGEKEYHRDIPLTYDNLWNNVVANCEVVAEVFQTQRTITIEQPVMHAGKQRTDVRGRPLVRRVTDTVPEVTMSFEPSERNPDAKKRYASMRGSIILDRRDPWSSYEKAVLAAIETDSK